MALLVVFNQREYSVVFLNSDLEVKEDLKAKFWCLPSEVLIQISQYGHESVCERVWIQGGFIGIYSKIHAQLCYKL